MVLEHPTRQMPGNRLDYVIRLAGFEQSCHRVPQIGETQARQTGRIA